MSDTTRCRALTSGARADDAFLLRLDALTCADLARVLEAADDVRRASAPSELSEHLQGGIVRVEDALRRAGLPRTYDQAVRRAEFFGHEMVLVCTVRRVAGRGLPLPDELRFRCAWCGAGFETYALLVEEESVDAGVEQRCGRYERFWQWVEQEAPWRLETESDEE